jgi:hypothetical protein
MAFYKIRHKETGLFWKGGGINVNNKSRRHIYKKIDGQLTSIKLDYSSKDHALEICFSKTGKVWTKKNHVTTAMNYGHETGLNQLLNQDCEVVEYPENQLTLDEISKIFESGLNAARLVWQEGCDVNFDEVFKNALKGNYLTSPE